MEKPNTEMTNKIWINKIHFADINRRADLSEPISDSRPNEDYVLNSNSQVEIDLRGTPGEQKVRIKQGDIIYIAANGYYNFEDGEKRDSLRIVARGVVEDVKDRPEPNGKVPYAIFKKGSFKHLAAPMINGLDEEILIKDCKGNSRNLQSPYWSIDDKVAKYIDDNIFIGLKSI